MNIERLEERSIQVLRSRKVIEYEKMHMVRGMYLGVQLPQGENTAANA